MLSLPNKLSCNWSFSRLLIGPLYKVSQSAGRTRPRVFSVHTVLWERGMTSPGHRRVSPEYWLPDPLDPNPCPESLPPRPDSCGCSHRLHAGSMFTTPVQCLQRRFNVYNACSELIHCLQRRSHVLSTSATLAKRGTGVFGEFGRFRYS